jgi:hypothetical protein
MTVTNFPNGISTSTLTATGEIAGASIAAAVQHPVELGAANGAIAAKSGVVMITKGTAAAMTLAAPTAGTDDGKVLLIVAATAAAHTVTQTTPGFNNAGASGDVATFGGAIGDNLQIVAYNGRWHVLSLRNVTLA